jgi:hypothetical protein
MKKYAISKKTIKILNILSKMGYEIHIGLYPDDLSVVTTISKNEHDIYATEDILENSIDNAYKQVMSYEKTICES